MLDTSYLNNLSIIKLLAKQPLIQIKGSDLFESLHDEDNSIAIIIQHLCGNINSRWTNIFTEDGEKNWKNRDNEFLPIISDNERMG